jgi:hypothetical protein
LPAGFRREVLTPAILGGGVLPVRFRREGFDFTRTSEEGYLAGFDPPLFVIEAGGMPNGL